MIKVIEKINTKEQETFLLCPYITIVGTGIQIENYKKVFKYTENEIIIHFSTHINDIEIQGEKLRINLISSYVLRIEGNIKNIKYINK